MAGAAAAGDGSGAAAQRGSGGLLSPGGSNLGSSGDKAAVMRWVAAICSGDRGVDREAELDALDRTLRVALAATATVREDHRRAERHKLTQQISEDQNAKLCVVCQDDTKSVLLLPCRHLCVCRTCSRRPELDKCPMCRSRIEQKMDVYA